MRRNVSTNHAPVFALMNWPLVADSKWTFRIEKMTGWLGVGIINLSLARDFRFCDLVNKKLRRLCMITSTGNDDDTKIERICGGRRFEFGDGSLINMMFDTESHQLKCETIGPNNELLQCQVKYAKLPYITDKFYPFVYLPIPDNAVEFILQGL